MKKILLLVLLAGMAACNTVAGLGEDISGGARATQDILN
ncbi:MAG TPA: entericidin, EcnA/B family [Paracoccaceae bacterium]|nr:entericidin, EcnA/B family [Paracoccaceae bacterium]